MTLVIDEVEMKFVTDADSNNVVAFDSASGPSTFANNQYIQITSGDSSMLQ